MRTPLAPLTLLEPKNLRDALRILRIEQSKVVPIAGCTDVFVALNAGTEHQTRFLNLWHLSELRGIGLRGDLLSIGALSTYTELMRSPLVQARLPILCAASREVGGRQVQNRGTLGGNIANASPAGDTLPVLAVADATVVLRSEDGTRRVPFTRFYVDYRKSVMRPDELVISVEIPPVEGEQWFRKVGTRAAQAISKVVMAAVRGPQPRVAVGSVASTVLRLGRTEAILAAGGTIEAACAALSQEIAPIDDLRSTAAYRHQVAKNLLVRFWTDTRPV